MSWSALLQVMAWCLLGTKPLPEPMLTYCQLEQISVKCSGFHLWKCIWKCHLQNICHLSGPRYITSDLEINPIIAYPCRSCTWMLSSSSTMVYSPHSPLTSSGCCSLEWWSASRLGEPYKSKSLLPGWCHDMEALFSSHYWPFVRGIHRSQVDFPSQGPIVWNFGVFFVVCLNKLLNKQSNCGWFEMLQSSCEIAVIHYTLRGFPKIFVKFHFWDGVNNLKFHKNVIKCSYAFWLCSFLWGRNFISVSLLVSFLQSSLIKKVSSPQILLKKGMLQITILSKYHVA